MWYIKIVSFLRSIGYEASSADKCLFVHKKNKGTLILYVDDMLIASYDSQALKNIQRHFEAEWKVTVDENPAEILGVGITYCKTEGTIAINQKQKIKDLCEDFKILGFAKEAEPALDAQGNYIYTDEVDEDGKKKLKMKKWRYSATPPATPEDPNNDIDNLPVPETDEEKAANLKRCPDLFRTYRSLVGSLMYIMVATRPDIGHAVSSLAKQLSNPSTFHLAAGKRVARYLAGTINKSIVYQSHEGPFTMEAYTDSDWAGCKRTRRSQSGGVIFAAGGAVMWHSVKQPIVTLSSAEAELTALTTVVKDVMWLRKICMDLDLPQKEATPVYCDNIAAMQIAEDSSIKRKTKHTDTYYHFVRDEIKSERIALLKVDTNDNVGDLLTKACKTNTFLKLRDLLMTDIFN
jgi:hypothetical protein